MVSHQQVNPLCEKMQGHQFSYPLRPLETEGCDLILGGDCSKSCTPIELDYDLITVTVTLLGQKIRLHAHTSNEDCQLISNVSLFQLLHSELNSEVEAVYLVTALPTNHNDGPKLEEILVT